MNNNMKMKVDFHKDSEYFGLKSDDLKRNDLILKCTVLEIIKKRRFICIQKYKDREMAHIGNLKPLTQSRTSDRQIKNKVEVVQDKMKELGFKTEK